MKRLIISLSCAALLLTFTPVQSVAAVVEEPSSLVVNKPPSLSGSAGMNSLVKRRDENRTISKAASDSETKKAKAAEARSKRHTSGSNGSLYISGGGLLLLILVLIIIF